MLPPAIVRLSVPRKAPPPTPPDPAPAKVEPAAELRAFIDSFEERLWSLGGAAPAGGLSRAELRVLRALGSRRGNLAKDLSRRLGIDKGYLSRIVNHLVELDLATRVKAQDARQSPLAATGLGRALLRRLARQRDRDAARLLKPLPPASAAALVQAIGLVRHSLRHGDVSPDDPSSKNEPGAETDIRLRIVKPGDVALLAHRLVEAASGAAERQILTRAAAFLEGFNRTRDIGWIAERDRSFAAACLLKGMTADAAELTLIHVEPEARGAGLAEVLIGHCLTFAKIAKYVTLTARVPGSQSEIEDALEALEFKLVRGAQDAAGLGRLWARRV